MGEPSLGNALTANQEALASGRSELSTLRGPNKCLRVGEPVNAPMHERMNAHSSLPSHYWPQVRALPSLPGLWSVFTDNPPHTPSPRSSRSGLPPCSSFWSEGSRQHGRCPGKRPRGLPYQPPLTPTHPVQASSPQRQPSSPQLPGKPRGLGWAGLPGGHPTQPIPPSFPGPAHPRVSCRPALGGPWCWGCHTPGRPGLRTAGPQPPARSQQLRAAHACLGD